jgi:hypothetical protein
MKVIYGREYELSAEANDLNSNGQYSHIQNLISVLA